MNSVGIKIQGNINMQSSSIHINDEKMYVRVGLSKWAYKRWYARIEEGRHTVKNKLLTVYLERLTFEKIFLARAKV